MGKNFLSIRKNDRIIGCICKIEFILTSYPF